MKYTVIGYKHSTGKYQGYDYDNYVFSCVRQSNAEHDEKGEIAEIFKVKANQLTSIPEIGAVVEPVFNRYGQCFGFLID